MADCPTGLTVESPGDQGRSAGVFVTTHWSVVVQAGAATSDEASAALERLCRQYWQPLYVFVRRQGYREHDAQDLTQGFIAGLLEKNAIARADRARGRFRTFLLSALSHYLANQQREQLAQKRGGGRDVASLDDEADADFARELSDGLTPERHYEHSWALAVLARVMDRLREEYAKAGRLALFEAIQPNLSGAAGRTGYARLGEQLGMSESTMAVAVHRMRRRYGEFLREEIAATVTTPQEAEEELRHLLLVVSDGPKTS